VTFHEVYNAGKDSVVIINSVGSLRRTTNYLKQDTWSPGAPECEAEVQGAQLYGLETPRMHESTHYLETPQ
jgi:hypothetical protein